MAEARAKGSRLIDEQRIKGIYKKLEGLTFEAFFVGFRKMRQFYLNQPRMRPVYSVKGTCTSVLKEIYHNMTELENEYGGEIWKGITTSGGTYTLWATEHSVGESDNGVYHIPSGGVEVIANRTNDFLAIVNTTVEKGRRKRLLETQQSEGEEQSCDKQADIQKEVMLKKLRQAKANNKTLKVSYTTVLFTGSAGVGKTTLLSKLNKERLRRYHHSTGIAKSKHTICVKTTAPICVKTAAVIKSTEELQWTNINYDSMIIHLNKHLDTLRFPSESSRIEDIPGSTRTESGNKKIKLDVHIAKADGVAIDIAKADSSNAPSLGEVWDIINFLDTGGQPEFVNILPAVSSSIALTFIVFNLSEGLDSLVHVKHNVHGEPSFKPYHLDCTNLEFIKCLMVSSENFNKNITPSLKSIQREDGSNDSKICYVGTHALDLSKAEIQKIDRQLSSVATELKLHQRSFWSSPKKSLKRLFPVDMFPVNQDQESSEDIIENIRDKIQKHVQRRDYFEIPITWFIFLLKLQRLCNVKKVSYISYQKAVDVWNKENVSENQMGATSNQYLHEDQHESDSREDLDVHNILLFFHFMGMLFYYHEVKGMCDFIFVDRQWLFEKLTELVEIKFTKSYKNDVSAEDVEKFTMEGRLSINIIKNLKIDLQGIEPLHFINLLDHLNIVAPLDKTQRDYFMPCVLPNFPLTKTAEKFRELDEFYGNIKHTPLLVGFKNGPMPHEFFCHLIVELFRHVPKGWCRPLLSTEEMQHVYSNLITFSTTSGHNLSLFYKIGYLEVQVRHEESQPTIIHYYVLHKLDKALRKASDRLKLNKEQLCYGFSCKCKTMQHFAKLEELTSPTEYITCGYGNIKLTGSHKVWLQETEDGCTQMQTAPTMQDLLSSLQGLNDWETFGYFLLNKDKEHIVERIKRDNQRVVACKTALYQEFFKHGEVTWERVINALKSSDELTIAEQVKMKIMQRHF